MVNGLMRTLAPRRRSPAELMKALNDALVQRKVEGRYVTLLLVLWHPHSQSFTMANAGGSPPMVCRERRHSEAAGGRRAARPAAGPRIRRKALSGAEAAIWWCSFPTAFPTI